MNDSESRLQVAEERLDKVQAVLDEVRKVLGVAEKAEAAAERARADVLKVNFVVLGTAAILAILVVLFRRAHSPGPPPSQDRQPA
jgi:ABC-type hemin transport system substrate-binding protein